MPAIRKGGIDRYIGYYDRTRRATRPSTQDAAVLQDEVRDSRPKPSVEAVSLLARGTGFRDVENEGRRRAGNGQTEGSVRHNHRCMTSALRDQLARVLDWEEAHVGIRQGDRRRFLPTSAVRERRASSTRRGSCSNTSAWRRTTLLDFCVNPTYKHTMKWPDDYWPGPDSAR